MRREERRGLVGHRGRLGVQAYMEAEPSRQGNPDQNAAASQQSRLDYMADLIAELRTMAAQMQIDMLERLLDLAEDEALRAARAAPPSSCTRDTL